MLESHPRNYPELNSLAAVSGVRYARAQSRANHRQELQWCVQKTERPDVLGATSLTRNSIIAPQSGEHVLLTREPAHIFVNDFGYMEIQWAGPCRSVRMLLEPHPRNYPELNSLAAVSGVRYARAHGRANHRQELPWCVRGRSARMF